MTLETSSCYGCTGSIMHLLDLGLQTDVPQLHRLIPTNVHQACCSCSSFKLLTTVIGTCKECHRHKPQARAHL